MLRNLIALVFVSLFTTSGLSSATFDPRKDGFCFANETAFAYGIDEQGQLHMTAKSQQPAFAHRCFCMVRGAMQFFKFARFEPDSPKVSPEEYRRRVRAVFRIAAWHSSRPAKTRIVIPGFPNLWSFSHAQSRLIQEEIGAWLPTYLRVGNWRMPCPITRITQGVTARQTERALRFGPQALFLTKFPSMNHAVLVFQGTRLQHGRVRFDVYDPNYPGTAATREYLPERNLFHFERRFYWPGGEIRAHRIYLSPLH